MVKCPECGKDVKETDKTCPYCGTKLLKKSGNGFSNGKIIAVVAVIVIIAIVAVLASGILSGDHSASDDTTSSSSSSSSNAVKKSSSASDADEYWASAKADKFHLPSCEWAKKISENNKIIYQSREDAIKDGKEPCGECNP